MINIISQLLTVIWLFRLLPSAHSKCQECYDAQENENCQKVVDDNFSAYTLHMSVHPHLDAFWIYEFEQYYDPLSDRALLAYFKSNRFTSVKDIFNNITDVLNESKYYRQKVNPSAQKAQRSFFTSEIGFFKRWYSELSSLHRRTVKELLSTKYWQILGGGLVENDQACTYYDDIIDNFQLGLRFLKQEFDYYPRAAISADSFGHSQSMLAILAHLGIEGFLTERSDEHLLLQNKTEFIWKAKSANGMYYGALPTHIRWAIHGFEDQFLPLKQSKDEKVCKSKAKYIAKMHEENQFLKQILRSPHILRYFGHDFQSFNNSSYNIIEGIMEKFSLEKCRRVSAVYGNPTDYFVTLMSEVFNKAKPAAFRTEDIMPIWDYDSGLYWTGYYTTDPFHKKGYRDVGRYLHAVTKAFLPIYIQIAGTETGKAFYSSLEELTEINANLQHHDGISSTSKYKVLDVYQRKAEQKILEIRQNVVRSIFTSEFAEEIDGRIFECSLEAECTIPPLLKAEQDIYLKIFNSGGQIDRDPIIVRLNEDQYYQPDCDYEINCLCQSLPCPCSLYLFARIQTYSVIKLLKVSNHPKKMNLLEEVPAQSEEFQYNQTHFTVLYNGNYYDLGYKKLRADPTFRQYEHLSRFGKRIKKSLNIKSGKYALGNNIKTESSLSRIKKVLKLESDRLKIIIIQWARSLMKTLITIPSSKNNEWKVETLSSAQNSEFQDLYFEVSARNLNNNNKFYTDSNGWLLMQRQLFKHQDYQAYFSDEGYDHINGNSYPMTAFAFIQDELNPSNKLSINTDRPQGVIAYHSGSIWVNFDRLTSEDGKWVFETTYRNEYQKFVHYVTVENTDHNERVRQRKYDEVLLIEGHQANDSKVDWRDTNNIQTQIQWLTLTGLKDVKFLLKPWNDSTTVVRVQNMHDEKQHDVMLFSKDNISPFLTSFYGNVIKYKKIIETDLGGNMQYKQFLRRKWNWHQVVDLTQENRIFDKVFQQKMTLRPLEIRTFLFEGLQIAQECITPPQIQLENLKVSYTIDLSKPMPVREDKESEERVNQYLLGVDHCQTPSPVFGDAEIVKAESNPVEKIEQKPNTIEDNTKKPDADEKSPISKPKNDLEIKSKIRRFQILNKQEKQIYFTEKLKEIRQKIDEINRKH